MCWRPDCYYITVTERGNHPQCEERHGIPRHASTVKLVNPSIKNPDDAPALQGIQKFQDAELYPV